MQGKGDFHARQAGGIEGVHPWLVHIVEEQRVQAVGGQAQDGLCQRVGKEVLQGVCRSAGVSPLAGEQ